MSPSTAGETSGASPSPSSALPLAPAHIAAVAVVLLAAGLLLVRLVDGLSHSSRFLPASECMSLSPEVKTMPAPDFKLTDLQGQTHKLSDLRGKVVFLNFWATWCPPCVEELPSMVKLQQKLAGQSDVRLLTVSVDEQPQAVKSLFAKRKDVNYNSLPVLMDPSRKVPESYGTSKFPETFIIDPRGMVRYRFIYKRDWASPDALACLQSLK